MTGYQMIRFGMVLMVPVDILWLRIEFAFLFVRARCGVAFH